MKHEAIKSTLFVFLFSTLPACTDAEWNATALPSRKFNANPLDKCLWEGNASTFNQICPFWNVVISSQAQQNTWVNSLFSTPIRKIMPSFVNTICFPILPHVISSVLYKVPFLSAARNAARIFIYLFKFHHLLPPSQKQNVCALCLSNREDCWN